MAEYLDHKHNGKDAPKIDSSNVEFNNQDCKNITTNRVDPALRDLDKAISKTIKGFPSNGKNFIAFDKDGQPVDTGVSSESLLDGNHEHNQYLKKLGGGNSDTILVSKKDGIGDTGIAITDMVVKKEIESLKNDIINKINKSFDDVEKDLINQIKSHTHDGYLTSTDLNSLKNEILTVITGQIKSHTHNYYVKNGGKENNISVFDNKGEVVDSSVSVNDIVVKNDIADKLDKVKYESGKILVADGKGGFIDAGVTVDDIKFKSHKHEASEITGLNIDNYLSGSSIIRNIVKEEMKKFLVEVIK